jgi:hypothetical protein
MGNKKGIMSINVVGWGVRLNNCCKISTLMVELSRHPAGLFPCLGHPPPPHRMVGPIAWGTHKLLASIGFILVGVLAGLLAV